MKLIAIIKTTMIIHFVSPGLLLGAANTDDDLDPSPAAFTADI